MQSLFKQILSALLIHFQNFSYTQIKCLVVGIYNFFKATVNFIKPYRILVYKCTGLR